MLDFGNIADWENPSTANETYEKEQMRVLDQLAPEKTKLLIKKEKKPWYDEEVTNTKKSLRSSEEIWIRNSTMISWKAYQQLRKLYQENIPEKRSRQ